MSEWYNKNIETLKKFGITEQTINYSANNENIMYFRDGAKEFLKEMNDRGIPIIVISAGVGNIIQQFLIMTVIFPIFIFAQISWNMKMALLEALEIII